MQVNMADSCNSGELPTAGQRMEHQSLNTQEEYKPGFFFSKLHAVGRA